MLVLSIIAVSYAYKLKNNHPKDVLFTYIFWLCITLVALSTSRSIGHALRGVLLYSGFPEIWHKIAPYTGGLNSIAFIAAATLTSYFPNVQKITNLIKDDARKLQEAKDELERAHKQLRDFNYTLEEKVKQRTRALLVSEQKFRRLFEDSKDAIFFCDHNGSITGINPSGVTMLGYNNLRDIIGRPLKDFFVNQEDWKLFNDKLHQQGYIVDFESRFQNRDGSIIYNIITAGAIRAKSGKIIGCEGIVKDITTFKKMTEKLIASEKMASIGQLSAGIAHELNTPLGIILGYTQLLKEDMSDQKEILNDLQVIEKQTKNCKRIVSDLLRFARSSKKKDITSIDVNETIKQTLAIIRHSLEMNQIILIPHLTEGLPKILGDENQLVQVIMNLINNARDAINSNGTIHIWTKVDGNSIKIIVGDTGEGIPEEIKRRIFDPFFTTKKAGQGTGLGLSVSYGIIKEHGGSIDVCSPPPDSDLIDMGIATIFILTLPIRESVPEEVGNNILSIC